jgi:hypothetical protein
LHKTFRQRKALRDAEQKIITLNDELNLLKQEDLLKLEDRFRRFENIKDIVYGHIEYRPLLYYTEENEPKGIGLRLLEEIFGKTIIRKAPVRGMWNNVVEKLEKGDYDVIATPLFETRERSNLVSFCSPIFFSDIGIYVKQDSQLFKGRVKPGSMTFEEAIKLFLSLTDKLKFSAIKGELSGKMVTKHLQIPQEKVQWLSFEESNIPDLIDSIMDEFRPSDVVFAENFQANRTRHVNSEKVINILKPHELLYPVSFAVRKRDYILRNYINLKLLEIEENYPDRIFGFLRDELNNHPGFKFSMADVKRYFVREKVSHDNNHYHL